MVSYGQNEPIGGRVQHETNLIGDGATTGRAIGSQLRFVQLDQVLGLPARVRPDDRHKRGALIYINAKQRAEDNLLKGGKWWLLMTRVSDPDGAADYDMITPLAHRVTKALANMHQRHAMRAELAECERSGVLEPLLRELGLSYGEFELVVANCPESTRRLHEMTQRVGVDLNHLNTRMQRELERSCSLCTAHARCGRWIDSVVAEDYPPFCPNGEFFESLRPHPAETKAR